MIPDLWHKNAIVYSLDVETYMDGNGDGCGDFEGLARRLDHLEALGVNTVWLGPFQPTPNRDNGYDVADYYGVDPRYGSLGDFVEFMHEARGRGIRVVMDLVPNHTSDRHPWFRAASSDVHSRFHDWYVWSKKRPPTWRSGMVFPGVQERTWTYARGVRKWYFHRFHEFQPDLNWENPQVREEIRRVIGLWLELGVAGFRVDAVPFVLEKPSATGRRQPLRFEYLHELRAFLQWRVGNAVLLGEANVTPREARRYFASDDGLHLMFNFWVNQHLWYALASGDARPLAAALRATRRIPGSAQWAHFLRNHDELDLGRLAPEQRTRVFEAFGPEPTMQLYGRGIRRRVAPMLGDRRSVELAHSLLLSLPGTPVLYYGDEIGMGDDLSRREREAVRTPMQWSAAPHGGFSPAEPVAKPVSGGPYGFERVNVEAQGRDGASLLRFVQQLVRLRLETPEIGWGAWEVVPSGRREVLALRFDWRGATVVCVHNFAAEPVDARLRLRDLRGPLVSRLDGEELRGGADGTVRLTVDARGYRWYRVGHEPARPRRGTPGP